MSDFVNTYSAGGGKAKANYYFKKLGFDIAHDTGLSKLKTMLMKYLEGLQWVLYYYYTGS